MPGLALPRNWNFAFWIVLFCAVIFAVTQGQASAAWVQDEQANEETLTEEEQLLLAQLSSPESTIKTFLKAMEDGDLELAKSCLQLSEFSPEVADAKGNVFADRLNQVLKNLWDRSFWQFAGDSDPDLPYTLQVADIYADQQRRDDIARIKLIRSPKGMWVFSRATLEAVDQELWDTWSDPGQESLSFAVWLEQNIPDSLRQRSFILKNYQWLCLLVLLVAGFVIGFIVRAVLNLLTSSWIKLRGTEVDPSPRMALWRPLSLIAHAATWYFGAKLFDLPSGFQSILLKGVQVFVVVSIVWTAFRAIDLLVNYLDKRAARSDGRFDDTINPILGNTLKTVATIVGLVLLINLMGWEDWKTVLGGFGVGGIAVAIASKDMIGNFFGSFTVLTDRPFELGDWVEIDGKVEGTVERVGIRSSRIRTFYKSEVIVPNSILTTAIVDNMGRRPFRRFKTSLNVSCNTSTEQLECFCEAIRQLLKNNPVILDDSLHVYVHELGESSIDILVYCFFDCRDWGSELAEKHNVLLDLMSIAQDLDIVFAYPTRTIEMTQIDLVDAQQRQAASEWEGKSSSELLALGRQIADRKRRV